jgi:putative endonuclease
MVECRDRSLYVGIATDLGEREKEHNWGVGAEYTAKRRPVKLVWWQEYRTQDEARQREVEIKGWSRKKKFELIRKFERERGAATDTPFASLREAQGKGE